MPEGKRSKNKAPTLDTKPVYLDLTKEKTETTGRTIKGGDKVLEEKPYDSRPQEDSARRRIAYILLIMLGVVIAWALALVSFFPQSEEIILKVLQIILGPLVALVSAATGFYFGSRGQ